MDRSLLLKSRRRVGLNQQHVIFNDLLQVQYNPTLVLHAAARI